jgi:hypothetical protein
LGLYSFGGMCRVKICRLMSGLPQKMHQNTWRQ